MQKDICQYRTLFVFVIFFQKSLKLLVINFRADYIKPDDPATGFARYAGLLASLAKSTYFTAFDCMKFFQPAHFMAHFMKARKWDDF